jgi:hypothetical protein
MALLALPWALAACQGPLAASPPVAARVLPAPHPERRLSAENLALAGAFLRAAAADLRDAARSISFNLPGRARRDARSAEMLCRMARAELGGGEAPAGLRGVQGSLDVAAGRYLAATTAYIGPWKSSRAGVLPRVDRNVEVGSGWLRAADTGLSSRHAQLGAVMQLPAQLAPPLVPPTSPRTAAAPARPAPTPQPPTAAPQPTAPPSPPPGVSAAPRPPEPTAPARVETNRVALQPAMVARVEADLRAVPARLERVRGRIEQATSTPDYDPALLQKAAEGIRLASTRLAVAQRDLQQGRVLPPIGRAVQALERSVLRYRAAASELALALQQARNGQDAALLADLRSARDDTAQGDVALRQAPLP